uniref:RNA-directed DNA polymerase n=1 Tax=Strongyloides venezuelensis TaxID=75913 RepID=A0A0K0FAX0_STRVS
MPMGLTGSPGKFQEIMDEVLDGISECYVYLDDILTCNNDVNSHLKTIDIILQRIITYGMKISLAKCQFGQNCVKYLGFRLDFKELCCNSSLLYGLEKDFKWEQKHTNAFEAMKKTLIDAAILPPPDNSKNYTIFTDASFQGLGAALTQQGRSIAFASRSLKTAEKNYPIIKLEALGLNKELESILQRYQMAIMEYDLTIQYVKGKNNAVAYYLSRNDFLSLTVKEETFKDVFPDMVTPYDKPYIVENMKNYLNDEEAKKAKEGIFTLKKGGIRVYVPSLLREKSLTRFHNSVTLGNHLSLAKIGPKFKDIFDWKSMNSDMNKTWTTCDICNASKDHIERLVETTKRHLPTAPGNWAILNADYMQVDDENILVIIDEYSKFAYAVMLYNIRLPLILRSDNRPAFISKAVKDYTTSIGIEQQFGSSYNHKSNVCVERFNRTLREAIRVERLIAKQEGRHPMRLSDIVYHFTYAYNRSKHLTTGIAPATLLLNIPDHLANNDSIHNGYSDILQLYKSTKIELKDENIRRKGIQIQPNDLVMKKIISRKDTSTSNKNQPTWDGPYKVIQCLYGDTYEIEKIGRSRKTRQNIEKIHRDMLKLHNK